MTEQGEPTIPELLESMRVLANKVKQLSNKCRDDCDCEYEEDPYGTGDDYTVRNCEDPENCPHDD